jgi:hypothetical protein
MFGYGRVLLVQILVTTFLVFALVTVIVLLEAGRIVRLKIRSLDWRYGRIDVNKLVGIGQAGTRLPGCSTLGSGPGGASIADSKLYYKKYAFEKVQMKTFLRIIEIR